VLPAVNRVAFADEPQLGIAAGRATDSNETDVARIVYRRSLVEQRQAPRPWWQPTDLQLGFGLWRVPDLRRRTRRYDASVTPVWRMPARTSAVAEKAPASRALCTARGHFAA
jgi:hypothetical protein